MSHKAFHITHLRLPDERVPYGTPADELKPDPRGGVTVAFRIFPLSKEWKDAHPGTEDTHVLCYGLGVCNPNSKVAQSRLYNRKGGVRCATGRSQLVSTGFLRDGVTCAPFFKKDPTDSTSPTLFSGFGTKFVTLPDSAVEVAREGGYHVVAGPTDPNVLALCLEILADAAESGVELARWPHKHVQSDVINTIGAAYNWLEEKLFLAAGPQPPIDASAVVTDSVEAASKVVGGCGNGGCGSCKCG